MSAEFNVSDDIKEFVNQIITKHDLDPDSEVIYSPGSELGDGYLSKTVAVDIRSKEKTLHLFLKCALNIKFPDGTGMDQVYFNEVQFYEIIAPAFLKFLEEKGVQDGFRNVPKCYGTLANKHIALENLKMNGYSLCDRMLVGNEQHIALVFKTYAKFHAISFAFKDQNEEEYTKIIGCVKDLFGSSNNSFVEKRLKELRIEVNDLIKQLDPIEDGDIVDKSEYVADEIVKFFGSFLEHKYVNSVMIQGDCWCNNMMFLYKDNLENPLDVVLIDWQVIRVATPVFDLAYFFYTAASASEDILSRFDHFLKIYHEELSEQIRKLGSDPEALYPFSALEEEWKRFGKFGYVMAYTIIKAMLSSKDEVPDLEQTGFENIGEAFTAGERNNEYVERMRNLTRHFLQNNFI